MEAGNPVDTTNNLRSKIEFVLNIVVAIAVVIVAVVTVARYVSPAPSYAHDDQGRALVGTRMTLTGVSQPTATRNLVFFMRKDCPACKIAAPLYRKLSAEASKQGVTRVAILPDALQEGLPYLRSLELDADHVRSADLSSFKISSVPTAVVLDRNGIVKGAWVGVVPGREEETRSQIVALLQTTEPE